MFFSMTASAVRSSSLGLTASWSALTRRREPRRGPAARRRGADQACPGQRIYAEVSADGALVSAGSWAKCRWSSIVRMAVCQHCGEDNPERARFCLACAAPLAAPGRQREERKVVSVLFCDLVGFTAQADAGRPRGDPGPPRPLPRPGPARDRALRRHGREVHRRRRGGGVRRARRPRGRPRAGGAGGPRRGRGDRPAEPGPARAGPGRPGGGQHRRGGGPARRHPRAGRGHFLTGDVANTASRLQAIAPVGGVLVGETTWRATSRLIDYSRCRRSRSRARPRRCRSGGPRASAAAPGSTSSRPREARWWPASASSGCSGPPWPGPGTSAGRGS